MAKNKFKRDDIALFSEVNIKHFNLPGVGPIQGSLDYLTSKYIPAASNLAGRGQATIALPHFLCTEAKRAATIEGDAAVAQVIAQLLTLDHMNPYLFRLICWLILSALKGRSGLLTDGTKFVFYYLKRDDEDGTRGYRLYQSEELTTKTEKEAKMVLGALMVCVSNS